LLVFRSLLAGLFTLRSLLMLLGLIALALVIWLAGPLVSFGAFAPLEPASTRIALIGGIFAVVIVVTFVRHWLAWRANRKMIASLLESDTLSAITDNRSSEETDLIRERFDAAMRALQETVESGAGKQGYLAELPWYIIIGPPGAGKTTILKNAGLEFPLAEKLGNDPISGVGGTRNCDWWFTDRAVLIDTAGRYTTQDVNSEVDRASWRAFLDILKSHRRRRPINGVLLAISLSDVLLRNEADRKRQVDTLRRRLQELMKAFGMQMPVYLLITKSDLIAGFAEYFDDLDDGARRQVWGMTFPLDSAPERVAEEFDKNFDGLAQNLETGLVRRMHSEANIGRRAAMFSFPKEFGTLRGIVGSFVADVFRPSKYETVALLRGVYFTSGTQEGTPIDRLIGVLSRNFGLQETARPPFSGQGKAYFIHRLLTDVVFPEAGIVGVDRKLERQIALLHAFGYAAAACLVVGLGLLWFGALSRSEARIADTSNVAQTVKARLAEMRRPATFTGLLPLLDEARGLKSATGEGSLLAWLDGFGLSATPTLARAAQGAYDRLLFANLLPSFADRVAARLQAALGYSGSSDPKELRDTLKIYLMLGDADRFDRSQVAQAAHAELPLVFPLDPTRSAAMGQHLDRMMELLPHPIAIDRQLVASVRARLTRQPRVEQIYAELLREAAQDPRLHSIDLVAVVGSTSLQISLARDATQARASIPGAFTREGFFDFVIPRLPIIVREQQGSDWVLTTDRADDAALQNATRDVVNRYIQDYIANWSAAINAVSAIRFVDLPRGISVLQGLADPQSPLQRLVDVIKDNTDLPPPGEEPKDVKGEPVKPAQTASLLPSVSGLAAKASTAAITSALGDVPWPGKTIGAPFLPLLTFVSGGASGQAPPIGKVRDDLGKLYNAMSGLTNAPDPSLAAFQLVQGRVKDPSTDVFSSLRAESAQAPAPIRNIIRDVANSSWAILLQSSYDYVNSAWQREVLPVCHGALDQRFPLFSKAKDDVTLRDFGDFFHPGGIIDGFFVKYLAPLVVDQRNSYVAAKIDGVPLPLKPDSLRQFQRARIVRNAFFEGSGASPAVKFSIEPVFLAPELLRATLRNDAQEAIYRHEPPRSFELEWPTKSDSSTVSVTLTLLDGTDQKFEASGPWALFRLFNSSQLVTRGTADRFTATIGAADGPHATYQLRAGSTQNPFNLEALSGFRCPDSL
jgi:type VI secretion system protein ImpL